MSDDIKKINKNLALFKNNTLSLVKATDGKWMIVDMLGKALWKDK
jgi:hypothetical protein